MASEGVGHAAHIQGAVGLGTPLYFGEKGRHLLSSRAVIPAYESPLAVEEGQLLPFGHRLAARQRNGYEKHSDGSRERHHAEKGTARGVRPEPPWT